MNLDEFTRTKKACARDVAEVRKAITERDELLEKQSGATTKQTVEMSAKIRQKLRKLRERQNRLSELQVTEQRKQEKKKKGALSPEDMSHRNEVCSFFQQHQPPGGI